MGVMVDIAWRPDRPGLISWAALALSGGALALYLGLQLLEQR